MSALSFSDTEPSPRCRATGSQVAAISSDSALPPIAYSDQLLRANCHNRRYTEGPAAHRHQLIGPNSCFPICRAELQENIRRRWQISTKSSVIVENTPSHHDKLWSKSWKSAGLARSSPPGSQVVNPSTEAFETVGISHLDLRNRTVISAPISKLLVRLRKWVASHI